MKITRNGIYTIALISAAGAAFMIGRESAPSPEIQQQAAQAAEVAPEKMIEILISAKAMPMGNRVASGDLEWAAWPEKNRPSFSIARHERPEALEDFQSVLVRQNVVQGETVTPERFILDKTTSFLSALLTPGMRAFALPTSPVDSAGGLILPGDRVDILQVIGNPGAAIKAQPLVTNVKVLAIGTETREPEGAKTLLGPTITLEVFPDQAELLASAQKSSGMTMALRPFTADAGQKPTTPNPAEGKQEEETQTIRIIRNGIAATAAP